DRVRPPHLHSVPPRRSSDLQLLDDGRLTDGQGRTVDFRNTVVIMTSNLRTPEDLNEHFRPEFLNRIDEVVVFRALTREQLAAIVDRKSTRVNSSHGSTSYAV